MARAVAPSNALRRWGRLIRMTRRCSPTRSEAMASSPVGSAPGTTAGSSLADTEASVHRVGLTVDPPRRGRGEERDQRGGIARLAETADHVAAQDLLRELLVVEGGRRRRRAGGGDGDVVGGDAVPSEAPGERPG